MTPKKQTTLTASPSSTEWCQESRLFFCYVQRLLWCHSDMRIDLWYWRPIKTNGYLLDCPCSVLFSESVEEEEEQEQAAEEEAQEAEGCCGANASVTAIEKAKQIEAAKNAAHLSVSATTNLTSRVLRANLLSTTFPSKGQRSCQPLRSTDEERIRCQLRKVLP